MKKKGDISIQVIVVAILALLVLVILSVMFITKMGKTSSQFDSCESKGGTCRATSCNSNEQSAIIWNSACEKTNSKGYKCCLPSDADSTGTGTI